MNKYLMNRIALFAVIFILVESSSVSFSASVMMNRVSKQSLIPMDGHIVFAPMDSRITYLIDRNGTVEHTWSSTYLPGEAVHWFGNGAILRTIKVGGYASGGAGGGVQIIQWDGTITWDFRYNTEGNLSHHDIIRLPNGNVLLNAWETKTHAEAVEYGRNPDYDQGDSFVVDKVIEVHPTGPTSGTIVWEWRAWDHLIQDYDASKQNYGVVADHPELMDINYGGAGLGWMQPDWLHINSVDYNEQLDQILLSVRTFNEVWIIDHSTTTAEAAGHTGGHSGRGGDLLYRWGNPEAYQTGTVDDKKFFGQHDATWIPPGCPGEGDILVFNNGANRPEGHYSTVDEIIPPVDENGSYYLEPGSAYGPTTQTWTYTANPPASFYSSHLSGAERLSDGNTLICDGEAGRFFEVTPQGETVWQYTNLFPSPATNNVFKIVSLPAGESPEPKGPKIDGVGSISWKRIKPGETVFGSFEVRNIGSPGSLLNWTVNTSSISWGTWTCTPFEGKNLTPEAGHTSIQVSVVAPNETSTYFEGYLRVENIQNPSDFDLIPVTLKTPADIKTTPWTLLQYFLAQFLQRHPFIEKLLSYLPQWREPTIE
jgi:hypothetical protein